MLLQHYFDIYSNCKGWKNSISDLILVVFWEMLKLYSTKIALQKKLLLFSFFFFLIYPKYSLGLEVWMVVMCVTLAYCLSTRKEFCFLKKSSLRERTLSPQIHFDWEQLNDIQSLTKNCFFFLVRFSKSLTANCAA